MPRDEAGGLFNIPPDLFVGLLNRLCDPLFMAAAPRKIRSVQAHLQAQRLIECYLLRPVMATTKTARCSAPVHNNHTGELE